MRDTLLFDLGNTLVRFDFGRAARAFSELTGREPAELQAWLTGPRALEICAGALHPHAMFDELAAHVGKPLDRARASLAWCDIFTPDAEMIALADSLAARHATHLWSNTDPLHWEFLRDQVPCVRRFRSLQLSYELEAAKPHRAYYVRALERGGVDPSRAVFIDDIQANLDGAAALGIATILHRSTTETTRALAGLGIVP